MPEFRFTAVTPGGEVQQGVMDAANEAAVVARLQRGGLIPMRAEPAGASGGLGAPGGFAALLGVRLGRSRALSRAEVADLVRELAVMLGAGLDLDRALRFLVDTAPNPRVATLVEAVRAAVRDGAPLATALAQHPRAFPAVHVGMVRAGEAGGRLAEVLDRLAGLLERQRALASGIRSAMVYPSILLVAAVGSIALLLTSVLPQFVPLFAQEGAALPASTQFLLTAGELLSAYGLHGLLLLGAGFLALRAALRRPGPRLAADRLLLRLPVLGGLLRDVLAARFGRTLGTLLVNGVPLIAALDVARSTLGNQAAAAAVDRAAEAARGGGDLSGALRASGAFPPRLVALLRLGHEAAELGPMALRAAEIHEEASRLGLQRLVSLLVPAITVVMGALVAGIVSSLLLAMLSLNDLAS